MQKKIIYSTAFTAMLTASAVFAGGPEIIPVQEDYFTGFYIGGIGGVNLDAFQSDNTLSTDTDIPGTTIGTINISAIPAGTILSTNDANGGGFTGFGGVQGGYNMTFKHSWVLGVVGFSEWGTQSQDSESSSVAPAGSVIVAVPSVKTISTVTFNNSTNSNTTVEIGTQYGVAGKLGYLFTPTTMLYAKIGAVWADVSVNNNSSINSTDVLTNNADGAVQANGSASVAASAGTTQNKVALLLGAGFEQFIYQDIISFNFEYDYANYGTVSASSAATAQATGTTVKNGATHTFGPATVPVVLSTEASVKVSTLLAGLNFYFGRNWF